MRREVLVLVMVLAAVALAAWFERPAVVAPPPAPGPSATPNVVPSAPPDVVPPATPVLAPVSTPISHFTPRGKKFKSGFSGFAGVELTFVADSYTLQYWRDGGYTETRRGAYDYDASKRRIVLHARGARDVGLACDSTPCRLTVVQGRLPGADDSYVIMPLVEERTYERPK